MQEEVVLMYPERDGIVRAKVPVLRGLVIEAPDRELVQHLAGCAIARSRPGSTPVFIDVSPEAAVEPNPWLDTLGIFADDPNWDEFVAEVKAARDRDDAAGEGASTMQFSVLLRPQPDGTFQASVPAIPGITASGFNREAALGAARCAILESLAGAEVATVDVPIDAITARNPLLETAGMFADDPMWDEFIEEMRAARARDNANTGHEE